MTQDEERQLWVNVEKMKKTLDYLNYVDENMTRVDSSVTIIVRENGVAHHLTFKDIDECSEYIVRKYMESNGRTEPERN